jgi:NitT/TauT family transport system ATP-binding protein
MPAKGVLQKSIAVPARKPGLPGIRSLRAGTALDDEQPGGGLALALRAVSKEFPTRRQSVTAFEEVTLAVEAGECLGVVGPSGCGKSTLLEVIAGLQEPSGGEVLVEGRSEAAERLRRCALMPQRDALLPWRSALDNAALALELAGRRRREARRDAHALFERFGLAGFEDAPPYELSGGMRQRVAFARTVLAGRSVLLLDEPFAALDSITRAQMQEWLAGELAADPRTAVFVTHDIEEALYLCDRVVVLSARPGRLREEIVTAAPRARPRSGAVTAPSFVALRQRALEALA